MNEQPREELPPELVESLSDSLASMLAAEYRRQHQLAQQHEPPTPKRGAA